MALVVEHAATPAGQPLHAGLRDGAIADEAHAAVAQLAYALDHHALLGLDLLAAAHGGICLDGVAQAGEHQQHGLLGNGGRVGAGVVADHHAVRAGCLDVDGVEGHALRVDELELGHARDELRAHRADGVGHDEVGVCRLGEDLIVGRAARHHHQLRLAHDGKLWQVGPGPGLVADHEHLHCVPLCVGL